MSDWRYFGPVAGVFWVWYFGIMFRPFGPLDDYAGSDFYAHRFWPFVFVDARSVRRA